MPWLARYAPRQASSRVFVNGAGQAVVPPRFRGALLRPPRHAREWRAKRRGQSQSACIVADARRLSARHRRRSHSGAGPRLPRRHRLRHRLAERIGAERAAQVGRAPFFFGDDAVERGLDRLRRVDRASFRRAARRARPAASPPSRSARTGWRCSCRRCRAPSRAAPAPRACSAPALSEAASPRLPAISLASSERMSPYILVVTTTSNGLASRIKSAAMASMMRSSYWTCG